MTRSQLLAAGVTDDAIRHRVAVKRLRRMHGGVYEIAGRKPDRLAQFAAGVLACGKGAVLSHRSAAALWNLRPQSTGPVHVTVPSRTRRQQSGLRVHCARSLTADEWTVRDGIPCTTPARTIVDCAAVLPRADVKRMLERAEIERVFDLPALEAAAARPGHAGARVVRALLVEMDGDVPVTRSEFEVRFLFLIDSARLPRPIVNGIVCGWEVDFHWPDARLVVETDGGQTHATRAAFHRDRRRDLDLELDGWHVIRISWPQLRDEPQRILALLRGRLGR